MAQLEELLAGTSLPARVTSQDVRDAIAAAGVGEVLVVLDDDPTGTQSIAGLPVLMAWAEEDFRWAFAQSAAAVYVMTNSRSLAPDDAATVTREVVTVAARVAVEVGLSPVFASRSDSTLRGHFPLEASVMQETIEGPSGVVLVPAFPEAGRITVGGMHYCRAGSEYVPAGESEFARDATFGYRASNLVNWVAEKTAGAVTPADVVTIGLEQLRTEPEAVLESVMMLDGKVLVCDIVTEEDLRTLSLALIAAEKSGKRFVYRVGPPFVRARIGQDVPAPLSPAQVVGAGETSPRPASAPGGIVVVGSHVGVTQRQLTNLKLACPAEIVEIEVSRVFGRAAERAEYLQSLVEKALAVLGTGSVIVQTSRELVVAADAQASLELSREVSSAVVTVVRGIVERVSPAFVLAKGGITSSDVASRALAIRRAIAVGPMLPGTVSLWLVQDGPAAGIPYVVFPGNVGDETALSTVVRTMNEAAALATRK